MTASTPEEAQSLLCPMSRVFGVDDLQAGCRGAECAAWRWMPQPTNKAAITAEMKRLGKGPLGHKQAVANVMADPKAHGVTLEPTHGFCGLAGTPEA